jgi:hypothetical protein
MSYVVEVQETNDGDCFIELPLELTEELNWQEGDVLEWRLKENGIYLWKINDPAEYEVQEG